MNKSESIKNIAMSLMRFQGQCPTIAKGNQAYGYKYADLPSIMETISPILSACNLAFTQLVGGDATEVSVTTILIHTESGEYFETSVSASVEKNCGKGMTSVQAEGSVITYLRRYSLSSILGIVTDVDTDGQNNKPNAPVPATAPVVQKPVDKAIIDTIASISTLPELKEFWDKNPSFKTDTAILNLVNAKKQELLDNAQK